MLSSSDTLVVARDPGAAAALLPVVERLRCSVVGLDHARPVFERNGVPLVGPSSDPDAFTAAQVLEELRPRVLVTGTSRLEVAALDSNWWQAAREAGIPSVAVLDHWIGYWQKFTTRERFDALPDVIAVMDDYARDQLRSLGCTAAQIVVTGQPAFDNLVGASFSGRPAARARWGVDELEWVVLFVSEPIAGDLGDVVGYDETDVLRMLVEALAHVPARLVVKPHPRESPTRLAATLDACGYHAEIETVLGGREAVAGADSVVGMTSILLLEAALGGNPVLSIQPGRREPWTEHFGTMMTTVGTPEAIRAWLLDGSNRKLLIGDALRRRLQNSGFCGDATDRVCRLISDLALRPRERTGDSR